MKNPIKINKRLIAFCIFVICTIFLLTKGMYRYFAIVLPAYAYTVFVLRKNKKNIDEFQKNTNIIWNISVLLALILIMRLFFIQVLNKDRYKERANRQADKTSVIKGNRGSIFGRTGTEIAYNVKEYELIINPKVIVKNEDYTRVLQEIDENIHKMDIDVSTKSLEKMSVAKRGSGYKIIAKNIDEGTSEEIMDYLRKNKIFIGSAFTFNKEIKRKYVEESIKQTIGRTGENTSSEGEVIGVTGIEKEYETYLKEKKVERRSLFTSSRDMTLPISKDLMEVSADGNNVYTTIDPYIQYILKDELEKQYIATEAEEALGIIMDPKTGEIIAAASVGTNNGVRNPIFQNQYEPGSTFKPLIVAAALNAGIVKETDTYDVGNGQIRKYNHTIRESSRSTRGVLTLEEVLKKSSNIGMVLISDEIENRLFEDFIRSYGIGSKTGVDYPGETNPELEEYEKWNGLKKNTMAFGQGIAVTPIQLITAFSSLINGGVLYEPYLVDRIETKDNVIVRRNLPEVVGNPISKETSDVVKGMLARVVSEGTGARGDVEGYNIGGKTGTAQISSSGGYIYQEYLASFIGFFPVENPEYITLVMFKKPQGDVYYQKFGGYVAGPVFKSITERIIKYKGMEPEGIKKISKISYEGEETIIVESDSVPDLKGCSAREAMKILATLGIELEIEGEGIIVEQSPKAGSELSEVTKIKIFLE